MRTQDEDTDASALRDATFLRIVRDVSACTICASVAHCHVLSDANGALDATIIFVAEAPGRRGAAVTRVPLSGDETGKRFDAFLAIAGIDRRQAFVTNAVLCNPTDANGHNRAPRRAEIAQCRGFLGRTLEVVAAPIVAALGRVALESLRAIEPHDAQLAGDTGRAIPWRSRLLVPLYHPGRQSTLHRSHAAQEDDWRRLGELCSSAPRLLP